MGGGELTRVGKDTKENEGKKEILNHETYNKQPSRNFRKTRNHYRYQQRKKLLLTVTVCKLRLVKYLLRGISIHN